MPKQLEFTKEEQEGIAQLLADIGSILILKIEEGVESPSLTGTAECDGVEMSFEINVKRINK